MLTINNIIKMQPVIKWSGSKRSQANEILKLIPEHNRYYEPFVGGASITFAIRPRDGVCADICEPLIDLWNLIKTNPESLYLSYKENWLKLQNDGYQTYYDIRSNFNNTKSPHDLLFITRTCVNGLIRFNKNGDFNNSLHHTRKGIDPERLRSILVDWSTAIKNVEFRKGDYRDTTFDVSSGDFVYLDPPYFNTKGRYYGTIDYENFIEYLETLNKKQVKYALSFDGTRDDVSYIIDIPKHLYKRHILLESGNSSFKKVMDKKSEKVLESLYLSW